MDTCTAGIRFKSSIVFIRAWAPLTILLLELLAPPLVFTASWAMQRMPL
jgi:hypothetical protein